MNLDVLTRVARLEQQIDRLVKPELPPFNIACRVYNDANISLADDTVTALTFNTERFDTDAMHSTTLNTSRLTCVHAGTYLIVGHVSFAINATNRRQVSIRLGGATYIAYSYPLTGNSTMATTIALSTIYQLAVGNYVELCAWQNSGGALNVLASGNYSPEFGMARLA